MNYTFKIDDERIKQRPDLKFYTGNINSYTFAFEFGNIWNGLIKFATFITEQNTYIVLIENNTISLPHEIFETPGICQFGIFATNGDDDIKRISTNLIDLEIIRGTYNYDLSPNAPTPEIWETIFKNSIPKIIDRYWYLYNPNTDEYLNTGILAEAITPQKGVDYLTPEDIETLGIDKKQDKSSFVKTSDISEEIDWYNSPYLTDDRYPSAAFVPKIMNYLFARYYPSVQIDMIMDDKENISNKTNSVTSNASKEKYTSEKAVYDYVLNSESAIYEHISASENAINDKISTSENTFNNQLSNIASSIWSVLSDGGTRKDYCSAFSYMYDLPSSPEFVISPTDGISKMFYNYKGTSLPANIDCSSITFDENTATSGDKTQPTEMFRHASNLKKIYDIGLPAMRFYRLTFHGATQLTEIEILRCNESTEFSYTFAGCTRIVNLNIDGTIGNNFDIGDLRLLNKDSFLSIINALSDNSTSKTVTFSSNAANKAFTETELTELIASKPNWTFSLN